MTKTLSKNYTDTPISGVTSLEFPRGLVNFGADFVQKGTSTSEQAVITNLTSPVGSPERIRINVTNIQNVYTGSNISAGYYGPSKSGKTVHIFLSEVWKVTDSVDATYEVALPVSASITLKIPDNELITPADVQTLAGRLVSCLYDTGSEATSRLQSLLRGSLLPSDI